MASQHDRFTAAGSRLVGISVDAVPQNAAMVAKLGLPFRLLADPGGAGAVKPYDLWHAESSIARPAVVVVAPGGAVTMRRVGSDFADRPTEEEVYAAVAALGLPATSQEPPAPGEPQPGERAVKLATLPAYYRGAKFAATALGMRSAAVADDVAVLTAEYDRYLEAVDARRKADG